MDNFCSAHQYTISTPDQVVTPGMICTSIYFIAMALTSESFITERSQGLLERSWVAGVLPFEIIASYIMSQFFVMVMQVSKIFYLPSFAKQILTFERALPY